MMYEEHVKAIQKVIRAYFDGVYEGNIDKLQQSFAPEARLYGDIKGEAYAKTLDEYLAGVKGRKSPSELSEKFGMEIVGIEVVGNIALVKAHLRMLGFNYYDFLSLCIVNGDWKIVNKAFAHVE
ncbi:MAG: nuclear transport factor 2 family protein [Cytophagales bacterium]|nr:nuclear transport factor 2 family protein [Cytophagales bacterium]